MSAINESLKVRVMSNDINLHLPTVNHGTKQEVRRITKSVKPVSAKLIKLKPRRIRAFSETK